MTSSHWAYNTMANCFQKKVFTWEVLWSSSKCALPLFNCSEEVFSFWYFRKNFTNDTFMIAVIFINSSTCASSVFRNVWFCIWADEKFASKLCWNSLMIYCWHSRQNQYQLNWMEICREFYLFMNQQLSIHVNKNALTKTEFVQSENFPGGKYIFHKLHFEYKLNMNIMKSEAWGQTQNTFYLHFMIHDSFCFKTWPEIISVNVLKNFRATKWINFPRRVIGKYLIGRSIISFTAFIHKLNFA